MPLLNLTELAQQEAIYEDVLVRELLSEVKFLWDQMAKRADPKKDFKAKVLDLTTTFLTYR